MIVEIPSHFAEERIYTLKVLLKEFLGLTFEYEVNEGITDVIISHNDRQLIIEDHFFNLYKDDYLIKDSIPGSIQSFSSPEWEVENVPVIYGASEISVSNNAVRCRLDLIASTFFMLTRWEEHVVNEYDQHGRFEAKRSLAYREGFLDRPIVNEYVELLFKLLQHIDPELKRSERKFNIVPTHDVDHLRLWKDFVSIRKRLAHNFITQKRIKVGIQNLFDAFLTKMNLKSDPFDSFDYLMNHSEEAGVQSRFYILGGGETKFDKNFNYERSEFKSLSDNIEARGHIIGYHPNYLAFENDQEWIKHKIGLEKVVGNPLTEGRHHFLRFRAPYTWQLWEEHQMNCDSTLGYHDQPGFRCGVSYPFSVFNFITREHLKLIERPLIFMEVTPIEYMKMGVDDTIELVDQLLSSVKKYKGDFVFLWHNSSLFTAEFKPYIKVYEHIMNTSEV